MGTFGEDCAAKCQFSREAQDPFAMTSVTGAKQAMESGAFAAEITPVTVKDRAGERVVSVDEGPGKVRLDRIPHPKPAFRNDGPLPGICRQSLMIDAASPAI
ncbi:Putative acetyl-coa acetyltransferase (plasmid) [Cupriavidus necator H16]